MENRKKPKIRFKGFTNAWEQEKITNLGNIFIGLVTTMTKHYTSEGTLLIRNSDIHDNYFDFRNAPIYLNDSFAQENISRMHKIGDVITVHTGDVGTSAVITKREENSIGFATIVTRPNINCIKSEYLSTFLNTEKHKKWAIEVSTGDGRTNYNLGDFYNLVVPITQLEEQNKISKIFGNINKLITLHQRKCEKLQNIKKSLLEKMFPKNNKKYPEIRFKGFTNAWEHQTFLETFDYSIPNNTLSRANLNDEEGIIKNIHYGDILVKYGDIIKISKSNIPYITDGDLNIYKNFLLQDGDIVIADTAEDETTGKAVEISDVQDNFVVAGLHTIVCRPKKKKQQYFLGYYINSSAYHRQLLPLLQGIKVYSISKSNLAKTYIKFPTAKKEQANIGKLFLKIDKLLTLHQQQINKLQNIKKALLEKMFV